MLHHSCGCCFVYQNVLPPAAAPQTSRRAPHRKTRPASAAGVAACLSRISHAHHTHTPRAEAALEARVHGSLAVQRVDYAQTLRHAALALSGQDPEALTHLAAGCPSRTGLACAGTGPAPPGLPDRCATHTLHVCQHISAPARRYA
jgi:hypothetical protein